MMRKWAASRISRGILADPPGIMKFLIVREVAVPLPLSKGRVRDGVQFLSLCLKGELEMECSSSPFV